MGRFLVLLDYQDRFLVSVADLRTYTSMDVDRCCALLTQYGHLVEKVKYSELDFTRSYSGYYVLYQSAEDMGVFYKNYMEDVLYYLEQRGAALLPSYSCFLAHHNKVSMELLRSTFHDEELKTIQSQIYGTGEEALERVTEFPVVLKSAEGSGSRCVLLARNPTEFAKQVRRLSAVFIVTRLSDVKEFLIYFISLKMFGRVQTLYRKHTFYRRKFIVQNFIEGLDGDYKVLYFGGKYYTLSRANREGDFRASGSGKFSAVREEEIPGLLDFCKRLTLEVDFPIIGMDVGFDGKKYHLFEFQFVHIGPYTLQRSQYWHEYSDGGWVKKAGKSNLEEEFCRSINAYVRERERQ